MASAHVGYGAAIDAGEFWSEGDYAIVGELWSAPGRDLAVTLDVAGCDVVDLATGTGVTAMAAARAGAHTVVGADAAAKLLGEASRRATAEGLDISWIQSDLASVPLRDRSVDLVVSTFGLIFAADPVAALSECRRLVRAGGRIVFTSWSATGLFGRLRRVLGPYFPGTPEPWHETPADLRAVVGEQAEIAERSFTLTVRSPEAFVEQLERYSAPFVVASRTLGDRWSDARAEVLEAVASAGRVDGARYTAQVSYLVTTLSRR